MKNQFDTRNRSASAVVEDLRAGRRRGASGSYVAILGSHNLPAKRVAAVLVERWASIVGECGFEPVRVITGCANVGTERAARLAAKVVTGKLAAVFHRADATFGLRAAEQIRDRLLAREADVLVLITSGGSVCKNAVNQFTARGKKTCVLELKL